MWVVKSFDIIYFRNLKKLLFIVIFVKCGGNHYKLFKKSLASGSLFRNYDYTPNFVNKYLLDYLFLWKVSSFLLSTRCKTTVKCSTVKLGSQVSFWMYYKWEIWCSLIKVIEWVSLQCFLKGREFLDSNTSFSIKLVASLISAIVCLSVITWKKWSRYWKIRSSNFLWWYFSWFWWHNLSIF